MTRRTRGLRKIVAPIYVWDTSRRIAFLDAMVAREAIDADRAFLLPLVADNALHGVGVY